MKIKFNDYNLEGFNKKEVLFCGIEAILITPDDIKSKFTQDNKIFRSSIWSRDGELLSASFPKFKNAGEDPDNFPMPKSLDGVGIVTKIDGSTCIVDFVNGEFSMRTRGVSSYLTQANYKDFEFCIEKYPKIKASIMNNPDYSFIFEIVTPNQKIVLDYGPEPDVILIGAIDKNQYWIVEQRYLDNLAEAIGVKRPEYHNFDSFEDIYEFCKINRTIEGFCLYFNNGQSIVKVKTDFYLALHRLFSGMKTIGNVIDVFLTTPRFTKYSDFYEFICVNMDFELAERCKDDILKVVVAYCKVLEKIEMIKNVINNVRGDSFTRKEQALDIMQHYGGDIRQKIAFLLLDDKPIPDNILKMFIEHELQ